MKKKTKRILYLDLLKVIALVLMACIHAYGVAAAFGLMDESIDLDIPMNIIYLVTPTIFMLAMGCGLYLSKNSTPGKLAKRGLKLLLTGFILNVIRGFIFYCLIGLIESAPENFAEGWYWLWGSDILYFAGLFFLLFALFRQFKLKDWQIFAVTAGMFVISNFLIGINVADETASMILGNFIYVDEFSYFPLLTWSIIPVVGYLFQKRYDHVRRKNLYIVRCGFGATAVLAATMGILFSTHTFNLRYLFWGEGDFLFDLPTMIITLAINFIYISDIYFFAKLIRGKKLTNLISNISANINKIYVIHWIFLMYLALGWMYLVDFQIQSSIGIYLLGIFAFAVAAFIASKTSKQKELKK